MSYFIFNETSSKDLDLIITERIIRPTWGKEVTETETAGGIQKLMHVKTTYPNAEMVIHTAAMSANPENIRKIYSTLNGFGTLWLSDYPDEYLKVCLKPIVPETKALYAAELPVYATVQPFAYLLNKTAIDLKSAKESYMEVTNAGTIFSAPEIRFISTETGSIAINVNGADFIVNITDNMKGREIIIDSEAEVAYCETDGSKYAVTEWTFNSFPLFHTGTNYIKYSGNLSSIKINVRERCL